MKKKEAKKYISFAIFVAFLFKWFYSKHIFTAAGPPTLLSKDKHQLQTFQKFVFESNCAFDQNQKRFSVFANEFWELMYFLSNINNEKVTYLEIQDIYVQRIKENEIRCLFDEKSLKNINEINLNEDSNMYAIFVLMMNSLFSFMQDKCQNDSIYIVLMQSIYESTIYPQWKLVLDGTKEGDEYHNQIMKTYDIPIQLRIRPTFGTYLWNNAKHDKQIIGLIVKKIETIVDEVNSAIDVLLCNIILHKEIIITKYKKIPVQADDKRSLYAISNKKVGDRVRDILLKKKKYKKINFNPFSYEDDIEVDFWSIETSKN